jgi:LPS-assembly protein
LRKTPPILSTILRYICHAFCFCVLVPLLHLQAQIYRPALAPPPTPASPSPNPEQPIRPVRPGAPDAEHVRIESVTQEANGPMRYLRGMVRIETTDMELRADELDYNSDTGELEARGHVHFEHFARGEKLDCARAEYNINTETGKFYDVSGSATARIQTRPGLLTTQNPFYFESKVAERLKDHYILHDGFLTDCTLPRPWWRLKGPTFEVVPGDHAIARSSWFYVRSIPIFYAPFFYKSLKKEPRRSGFLIQLWQQVPSREGYRRRLLLGDQPQLRSHLPPPVLHACRLCAPRGFPGRSESADHVRCPGGRDPGPPGDRTLTERGSDPGAHQVRPGKRLAGPR